MVNEVVKVAIALISPWIRPWVNWPHFNARIRPDIYFWNPKTKFTKWVKIRANAGY